jgi:hypothetical protein
LPPSLCSGQRVSAFVLPTCHRPRSRSYSAHIGPSGRDGDGASNVGTNSTASHPRHRKHPFRPNSHPKLIFLYNPSHATHGWITNI